MPILLAAALAIAAPLPAAADWYRVVAHHQGRAGYIDADSIRQDGQWTVVRVVTINETVSENGAKSVRADLQIDCKAQNLRIARFAMSGEDGVQIGELEWPDNGKLHDADTNTPFGRFAEFACGTDRSHGVRVSDPFTDKP